MMTQLQALAILARGDNVFLTGEPGSGKSYLIRQFVNMLRARNVETAVTASTGAAAVLIGGRTIHSWSGIRIEHEITPKHIYGAPNYVTERILKARVLIIDEISMLSAETLDNVDIMCRGIRLFDTRPFGGLQVVLVGDLFQLPPVPDRDRPNYEPGFVFESKVWPKLAPTCCYLSEQHRQADPALTQSLGAIRRGEGESVRAFFETRITAKEPKGSVLLYCHNFAVDQTNDRELAKLPGEPTLYTMREKGHQALIASLKQGCGSPEQLYLKVGAQVMFTRNDQWVNGAQRWVNGTLGVVEECIDDERPIVRTRSGMRYLVEPAEWMVEETNKREGASIFQVPLRLAWALTIHRSQGASLDAAHVDLSKAFTPGQGYVGLSRVRTLEGLTVGAGGISPMGLKVDEKVLAWDAEVRAASTEAAKTVADVVGRPTVVITPLRPALPAPRRREFYDGLRLVEILRVNRSFIGVYTVEFKFSDNCVSSIHDYEFGGIGRLLLAIDNDIKVDSDAIEFIVSTDNPMAGEKLLLRRYREQYTWLPLSLSLSLSLFESSEE